MSVSSVTSTPIRHTASVQSVEDSLRSWCEEISQDSSEYSNRRRAAEKIRECYYNNKNELDLSNNQLASLPDAIGSWTALQWLNLSGNRLASLPAAIGSLTALQWLNLDSNQLASLPAAIGSWTALQALFLDGNQLASLPDAIGSWTALQWLNLSGNRLASLPDAIGSLTALQRLYLSNNRLTSLPAAIGSLTALQTLYLNNNQLTSLPAAIGSLTALQELYLIDNRLTSLDSINHLPHTCQVDAQRNFFTPEYVQAFQQHLDPDHSPRVILSIHDDGFQGPDQTLEERLRDWFQEFEMTFPRQNNESLWNNRQPTDDAHFNERFRPLLDLTEDARNNLNEFLRRLRELKDYQKGGEAKNNIILRVDRMLQLACKNEEFKTEMLALITEALETCRDRVLIIFNDIEIRWQVHQEGLSKQDIKELCIRAQRYEEVKKNVLELAGYRHLGDQIETILYFLVQLRDKLNLPISTQGMAYQEVGAKVSVKKILRWYMLAF